MLTAPLIIEHWGWPALFYLYGALGLVWVAAFQALLSDISDNEPAAMTKLTRNTQPLFAEGEGTSAKAGGQYGAISRSSSSSGLQSVSAQATTRPTGAAASGRAALRSKQGETSSKGAAAAAEAPYRAFLRNPSLAALAATHFANNVFHYT
jgi:ACS family sodium-dependent inorganic phosphate cotransporter